MGVISLHCTKTLAHSFGYKRKRKKVSKRENGDTTHVKSDIERTRWVSKNGKKYNLVFENNRRANSSWFETKGVEIGKMHRIGQKEEFV